MFDAKKCPFLPQETLFTAFLSRMSRKSQHTRFEDKILGQVSFGGFPATCASLHQTIGFICMHIYVFLLNSSNQQNNIVLIF